MSHPVPRQTIRMQNPHSQLKPAPSIHICSWKSDCGECPAWEEEEQDEVILKEGGRLHRAYRLVLFKNICFSSLHRGFKVGHLYTLFFPPSAHCIDRNRFS